MESLGTTQIELVGGAQLTTILYCYMTLFLMKIKMYFRRVIHWEKELERNLHFTEEMTGDWESYHLLKVIQ
jgi:hypothetical protein